jgi:hypothetical protein
MGLYLTWNKTIFITENVNVGIKKGSAQMPAILHLLLEKII